MLQYLFPCNPFIGFDSNDGLVSTVYGFSSFDFAFPKMFLFHFGGYMFILSILCTDGYENDGSSDPSGKLATAQILSSESQAIEEVVENPVDSTKDDVQIPKPAAESEIPSASQVGDKKVEAAPKKNGSGTNSNGHTGSPSPKESITKGFCPLHFACSFCCFKASHNFFFCQTQSKQVENSNMKTNLNNICLMM
jgi:hypothetical protein